MSIRGSMPEPTRHPLLDSAQVTAANDAHPRFADSDEQADAASFARRTVALDLIDERVLEFEELELVVANGADEGARLVLPPHRVTIGAGRDADLRLNDATVSRAHAVIVPTDAGPLLVDCDSRNGTRVGGRRVPKVHLAPGLALTLGNVELLIRAHRRRERVSTEAVGIEGMVIASPAMQRLASLTRRVAPLTATVLIHGETGTGKEGIARAIHDQGPRADGPYVVFDCGAVARTLVDAELFGHERGAFTGAEVARAGAFERADGGTLFLDEIGELPKDLQPKLLRVLEMREVRRLGSSETKLVDVRVVAATHRDLRAEVRAERFRADLYHRLVVLEMRVPPLRDRPEDIVAIAEVLSRDPAVTGGRTSGISQTALARLQSHAWPGNVRELVNVIRAGAALSEASTLGVLDLPEHLSPCASLDEVVRETEALTFKDARDQLLAAFESDYLARVLRATRGNLSEAARRTGLHRKTVERMVRKHGLDARVLGGRAPLDRPGDDE